MKDARFDKKRFNYNKDRNLYSAEASTLGLKPGQCPGAIYLNSTKFVFDKLDMDSSREDVMGWLYMEDADSKPILDRATLLLIND